MGSPAQVVLPALAEDANFAGLIYYFCNASCTTSFEKDPGRYLAQEVRV